MLSNSHKTAAGVDRLPYWLFRNCAGLLSPIITHVFNAIPSSGTPPEVWKRAVVTPIPKINHPTSFKDLRPISVTSILSRLFEHLIVHKFLIPAIPKQLYVHLRHVTHLLETNQYVRCLFIDYSRAFDTISHEILIQKQNLLDILSVVIK